MKRYNTEQRWFPFIVNILLALLVVVPVYAASTIGTNLSTDGNIIINVGSGKLGVGTSTPGSLLSVQGNALISGNVTSVANITATGTLTLSGTTGTSTIASGQGFTIGSNQFVLQQGNGSVGIGTSSPMAALSLNAGQFVTAAGTAAAPSWAFTTDAASGAFLPAIATLGFSTGGTERARIDTNGRLGIGTTTPGTPLSVTGAGVFTGAVTFTWLNATSTTATSTFSTGGLTAGINQFVIQQNSGNVGVGTTTPAQLFSVQGSALISGDLTSIANITATGTLTLSGTTGTSTIASGQGFTIGSNQFVLQQSSGNIGIGTTSPLSLLTIYKAGATAANSPQLTLSASSTVAGLGTFLNNWAIGTDSNAGGKFKIASSSVIGTNDRFVIDGNGNVGIGTTSPGTTLGVTGAGVFTGAVTATNFAATSTTATSTLSTGGLTVGTTQFVVQQNSGNVGVGNSVPNTKFEVVGTASSTGLVVGGGTTLNGIVSGYCTFPSIAVTASTTNTALCASATGVLSGDRIFVQATSSLPENFVIETASSTAAAIIQIRILNTGFTGLTTSTGINSVNFWAFR